MSRNVFIHDTAIVKDLRLSDDVKIYQHVTIKNCTLSENVKIGDFSRIENSKFGIMADIQRYALIYNCEIGNYTYTGRNFTAWFSKIGKFCSISWNVSIGGANHDYNRIAQHAFLYSPQFKMIPNVKGQKYNRFQDICEIGNDVWIACNSVICRGVKVGDGAVIGAGAVVTKDIPPYAIVAGVPAKIIKRRCCVKLADRLVATRWWDLPPEIIMRNIDVFNSIINEDSVSQIENIVSKSSNLLP